MASDKAACICLWHNILLLLPALPSMQAMHDNPSRDSVAKADVVLPLVVSAQWRMGLVAAGETRSRSTRRATARPCRWLGRKNEVVVWIAMVGTRHACCVHVAAALPPPPSLFLA